MWLCVSFHRRLAIVAQLIFLNSLFLAVSVHASPDSNTSNPVMNISFILPGFSFGLDGVPTDFDFGTFISEFNTTQFLEDFEMSDLMELLNATGLEPVFNTINDLGQKVSNMTPLARLMMEQAASYLQSSLSGMNFSDPASVFNTINDLGQEVSTMAPMMKLMVQEAGDSFMPMFSETEIVKVGTALMSSIGGDIAAFLDSNVLPSGFNLSGFSFNDLPSPFDVGDTMLSPFNTIFHSFNPDSTHNISLSYFTEHAAELGQLLGNSINFDDPFNGFNISTLLQNVLMSELLSAFIVTENGSQSIEVRIPPPGFNISEAAQSTDICAMLTQLSNTFPAFQTNGLDVTALLDSFCGNTDQTTSSNTDQSTSGPQDEANITSTSPEPESSTSPGPESSTSPGPESSTSPEPESSTSPEVESSTSPGGESSTRPEGESSTSSEEESSTSPEGESSSSHEGESSEPSVTGESIPTTTIGLPLTTVQKPPGNGKARANGMANGNGKGR